MGTTLTKLGTGHKIYEELPEIYKDAFKTIEGQSSRERELAYKVVAWIANAKRPLSVSELQIALAVDIEELQTDTANLYRSEDMVSVCAGSVIVDEATGIISFIDSAILPHFEQMRKGHYLDDSKDEAELVQVCITYLSHLAFDGGCCDTDEEFEERLLSYPFYHYAATYWGHHACHVPPREDWFLEFFDCQPKVDASVQAMMAVKQHPRDIGYSQAFPRQMTGLHLAAYCGNGFLLDYILFRDRSSHANKDTYGRSPLWWAVRKGRNYSVKSLLKAGADVNSRDVVSNVTPISIATSHDHNIVVVTLVYYGAEVCGESTGVLSNFSRLLWAVRWEDRVLLRQQVSEQGAGTLDLLMHWVVRIGDETILERLFDHAAGKFVFNGNHMLAAVANGHENIVRLMLAYGVDFNLWKSIQSHGDEQCPLLCAITKGYTSIVHLLLTHKIAVNLTSGKFGETPLT